MFNRFNLTRCAVLASIIFTIMLDPAQALQWVPAQAKTVGVSTDFSFKIGKEVITCKATVYEGTLGKESSTWTSTPGFVGCGTSHIKAGSAWTITAVNGSEATLTIPKGEAAGVNIELSAKCKVRIEGGATLGAAGDFEVGENGLLEPSALAITEQKVSIVGASKECGESATTAGIDAYFVLLDFTNESEAVQISSFSSEGGKSQGKIKAGATTFTDEGATVTCESAMGQWKLAGALNIFVGASTAKPAGWEKCKTSIGTTAEVSACEFQLDAGAPGTATLLFRTSCISTSPGNCRIKVPVTGEKLGKTTLKNEGTNLLSKLEVEGIASEAESLGGFGCLGISNLKNKTGKEKGVVTLEGIKEV